MAAVSSVKWHELLVGSNQHTKITKAFSGSSVNVLPTVDSDL